MCDSPCAPIRYGCEIHHVGTSFVPPEFEELTDWERACKLRYGIKTRTIEEHPTFFWATTISYRILSTYSGLGSLILEVQMQIHPNKTSSSLKTARGLKWAS